MTNLADDPEYTEKLEELRAACENWLESIDDPLQPEEEIVRAMWPNLEQPVTATPEIFMSDDNIVLKSETEGASIGYQFLPVGEQPDFTNWKVYTEPFQSKADQQLWVRAHRIGYKGVTVSEMMK